MINVTILIFPFVDGYVPRSTSYCLKFNVRDCGDVGNAFIEKRAFTNSVDPDETPHNAVSRQGLRYLPC